MTRNTEQKEPQSILLALPTLGMNIVQEINQEVEAYLRKIEDEKIFDR
jgi:hypothetical protein